MRRRGRKKRAARAPERPGSPDSHYGAAGSGRPAPGAAACRSFAGRRVWRRWAIVGACRRRTTFRYFCNGEGGPLASSPRPHRRQARRADYVWPEPRRRNSDIAFAAACGLARPKSSCIMQATGSLPSRSPCRSILTRPPVWSWSALAAARSPRRDLSRRLPAHNSRSEGPDRRRRQDRS